MHDSVAKDCNDSAAGVQHCGSTLSDCLLLAMCPSAAKLFYHCFDCCIIVIISASTYVHDIVDDSCKIVVWICFALFHKGISSLRTVLFAEHDVKLHECSTPGWAIILLHHQLIVEQLIVERGRNEDLQGFSCR